MSYGMTEKMAAAARRKVKKNIDYMTTHGVEVSGTMYPFSDFVQNSYMNPDRYVAEQNNRVNSLYEYSVQRGLKNVFFTLTLPSHWHPTKKIRNGKRVPNPKYAGRNIITRIKHPVTGEKIELQNTEQNKKAYTPRNASKALTKYLKRLFDDRLYKSIQSDDRVYFRVTEPHKDGTPHIHVSFFVPENKVDQFAHTLKRLYPSPMGKVETNVENPVAYLMKYVLKTLDDLRYSDELTELSLWYVYHGIARIYTSRTLVDLETYRALNGRYQMIELTNMYRENNLTVLLDTATKKVTQIFDEFGCIYNKKHVRVPKQANYEDIPTQWKPKQSERKYIPVEIDGEMFHYTDVHGIHKPTPNPQNMKNLQLLEYYDSLDINDVDLNHYAYVQNLCIERGLIYGSLVTGSELNGFMYQSSWGVSNAM